ncbi:hypothetical protein AKJ40_04450 [candidate division MSBL1 archaeon SCGC-AAA259M10]|uniref:Uncharacterized protein n=1 Tax=candidate division MSBL1 archaeon SCGC-AAA259M10 TaxID=1698270 RepID=A0A133UX75_9EURY|nr:hypothetical protein AKJ40_04450 [candidate division MSBL1 archaeon SCGC-AAA259M10]
MRNPKPKTRNRIDPEVLDCREYLRIFEGRFTGGRSLSLLFFFIRSVFKAGLRMFKLFMVWGLVFGWHCSSWSGEWAWF